MIVVQLVERFFPTPEVRGLNPVIGKLLYGTFFYCQLYRKGENKEKEAGNGPFKKILNIFPPKSQSRTGKQLGAKVSWLVASQ